MHKPNIIEVLCNCLCMPFIFFILNAMRLRRRLRISIKKCFCSLHAARCFLRAPTIPPHHPLMPFVRSHSHSLKHYLFDFLSIELDGGIIKSSHKFYVHLEYCSPLPFGMPLSPLHCHSHECFSVCIHKESVSQFTTARFLDRCSGGEGSSNIRFDSSRDFYR